MQKLRALIAMMSIAVFGSFGQVNAASAVHVTLIDKVGVLDLSKPMQLGMGMHGDMAKAPMGMNVSPMVVHHGTVIFNVTNLASTYVHEVIVAPVKSEDQAVPYDEGKYILIPEQLPTLGEVAQIEPNKTASLTIDLAPGKYLLYCNLPGHFMAGMWAVIEVK